VILPLVHLRPEPFSGRHHDQESSKQSMVII
jgi:hypothetical protein